MNKQSFFLFAESMYIFQHHKIYVKSKMIIQSNVKDEKKLSQDSAIRDKEDCYY